MKICQLFGQGRPVFSFEVFPPKKDGSIESIYKMLDEMEGLSPDCISVTYGAGGNPADSATFRIAHIIKQRYHIEPLMHMTCVSYDRADVDAMLTGMAQSGIANVMALRGDINPEQPPKQDFRYASELIAYIRERSDIGISGACYPECHLECDDPVRDVLNLKHKVDAGCEHLVSQLFFDNDYFYRFLERARIAGINVPIEAGIMPVTNTKQIERMVTLCGASQPGKFSKIMQRYEHLPQARADAGIAYAVNQIVDLVTQGVDGIHLYTMNNPRIARRISESVQSLFQV
jgi:methylenetetrahydrofolate reductase (NADPH)